MGWARQVGDAVMASSEARIAQVYADEEEEHIRTPPPVLQSSPSSFHCPTCPYSPIRPPHAPCSIGR